MIPTKTLITLLRATPFDDAAFAACLKSGEGERLNQEALVALGHKKCSLEEQDCLPLYEVLAQYQTNLKDEKYKQAFYALLNYYVSMNHPYTSAMVANVLHAFHGLAELFPAVGIYVDVLKEIKQFYYRVPLLDDGSQQSIAYVPFEGLLKKTSKHPFSDEQQLIVTTFCQDATYQALTPDNIERVKRYLECLMVGDNGCSTIFSFIISPNFFHLNLGHYYRLDDYKFFIFNLADFVQKHNIRIQWSRDFAQSLVDLMLALAGVAKVGGDFSRLLRCLKNLQVNLNATGRVSEHRTVFECDLWWVLATNDQGVFKYKLLADLIEHEPDSVNLPHRFSGCAYITDKSDKVVTDYPLAYAMRLSYASWAEGWFAAILNAPSLKLTPELCEAVFKAQASKRDFYAHASTACVAGDEIAVHQIIAQHPVFCQQPGFIRWAFQFESASEFPFYVLTNLNIKLDNLLDRLPYVFAFSLWRHSELSDEGKAFKKKYGVTYEEAFAHWMMKSAFLLQTTCLQQNISEWVGPSICKGGGEPINHFRYAARMHFKDQFKKEPDRHLLKEAYLQFLSESPVLKSALLEALVLGRPCLFLNVLMSHKTGSDLKRTKDYEKACVLVRGAAISEAVVAHLREGLNAQKPAPYEAVLSLGLMNHDMSDVAIKQMILAHLLPGMVPLKQANPVRDALKLLSEVKYAWLLKKIGILTTELVQAGEIQKSQLTIDKNMASPLVLILNSGKRSRDHKGVQVYSDIMSLKLSVSTSASALFHQEQKGEMELLEGVRSRRLGYSSSSE